MHTTWHRLRPGQRELAAGYRVFASTVWQGMYLAPSLQTAVTTIPRLNHNGYLATQWSNQPDLPCWEVSGPK